MFIETQDGRAINISNLESIERNDNEIWGFTSDGKGKVIYQGTNSEDTIEEFDRIKRIMDFYCILIRSNDDIDDLVDRKE